ncbi:MAG: DNA polymerase III subunit delta [Firmicutes bacterium]|nr:DNA polymerase III subunit delta [Bacillota bacterium]
MAYGYYNQQEEHHYKVLQRDLKAKDFPKVCLLCGKEQFLVDWGRKEIINKFIEPASKVLDLTLIDEDDLSNISTANAIMESCETMPLLSPKKVVVVRDSKILSSGENKELVEYIGNIPDFTVLVFLATDIDGKRSIIKAIKKAGKVYDFKQLDRKNLISFIDKRFKAGGVSLTGKTMDFLLNETGYFNKESDYNLYTLSNDITKMIALAEGGSLTEDIIKETVEGDIDTFIFNLMNSLSEGRKDKAIKLLHNIIGDKSDVSYLTAMIVSQFEIMYAIKELMEDRVPDRLICDKVDIKEGRLKVLRPYVSKLSKENLRKNLMLAYEIDGNIKTGLLSSQLAMEMFVSRL